MESLSVLKKKKKGGYINKTLINQLINNIVFYYFLNLTFSCQRKNAILLSLVKNVANSADILEIQLLIFPRLVEPNLFPCWDSKHGTYKNCRKSEVC